MLEYKFTYFRNSAHHPPLSYMRVPQKF